LSYWAVATAVGGIAVFKHCRKVRFAFDRETKEKIRAKIESAYKKLDALSVRKAFRQVLRWLALGGVSLSRFLLTSSLSGLVVVLVTYFAFSVKLYGAPDGAKQLLGTHNLLATMMFMALSTLGGYILMSLICWLSLRYLAKSRNASWNKVLVVAMLVTAWSYVVFAFVVALLSSAGTEGAPLAHGRFVSYMYSWEYLRNRWWMAMAHPMTPIFTFGLNAPTQIHVFFLSAPPVLIADPVVAISTLNGTVLAAPALLPVAILLLALLFALAVARAHRPRQFALVAILRIHELSERWRDKLNLPINAICWSILVTSLTTAFLFAAMGV